MLCGVREVGGVGGVKITSSMALISVAYKLYNPANYKMFVNNKLDLKIATTWLAALIRIGSSKMLTIHKENIKMSDPIPRQETNYRRYVNTPNST